MKSIDLQRLKGVPILTVAHSLGMDLQKCGSGVWALKDSSNPKEPTSLRIFEKTNTFKRFSGIEFGGTSSGSTIDLVMHILDCDFKTALQFFSEKAP